MKQISKTLHINLIEIQILTVINVVHITKRRCFVFALITRDCDNYKANNNIVLKWFKLWKFGAELNGIFSKWKQSLPYYTRRRNGLFNQWTSKRENRPFSTPCVMYYVFFKRWKDVFSWTSTKYVSAHKKGQLLGKR